MTKKPHPIHAVITPRHAVAGAAHRAIPFKRKSMLYDAIVRTMRAYRDALDTLPPKR